MVNFFPYKLQLILNANIAEKSFCVDFYHTNTYNVDTIYQGTKIKRTKQLSFAHRLSYNLLFSSDDDVCSEFLATSSPQDSKMLLSIQITVLR